MCRRNSGRLFSGRCCQVLLALRPDPDSSPSVNERAEGTLVSPTTASRVLVDLERREWVWIFTRGSGPHKERMLQPPTSHRAREKMRTLNLLSRQINSAGSFPVQGLDKSCTLIAHFVFHDGTALSLFAAVGRRANALECN